MKSRLYSDVQAGFFALQKPPKICQIMRSHKSHKTWHFIYNFYRCKHLVINVLLYVYATAYNRIYYILYI
nr:MAG TPA: hypothetical protein [Caudoviricetes sp.]